MTKIPTIVFTLFVSFVWPASAEPVHILGKSIPQLLTTDPSSMFHGILVEAAKRANLDIKVEVLPGKRALTMFNAGKGDILAPVQLELMHSGPFKVPVIGSEPVLTKYRHIFSKEGHGTYSSLADLAGKRVGLVRGYRYGNHIDQNDSFRKILAKDVRQLILMINRGRIDAFIAFPNAIHRFSKIINEEVPNHDKEMPVTTDSIAYAFRDTERGRELRDRFSAAIISMRVDGTLSQMTRPMEPE